MSPQAQPPPMPNWAESCFGFFRIFSLGRTNFGEKIVADSDQDRRQ
jgi:hypothetical protein